MPACVGFYLNIAKITAIGRPGFPPRFSPYLKLKDLCRLHRLSYKKIMVKIIGKKKYLQNYLLNVRSAIDLSMF